jgi:phosphate transport system permease protein
MASNLPTPASPFPEGAELQQQAATRQRRGWLWKNMFLLATMVGILALMALLYNIINGAFGYIAVQNEVDPDAIVLAVEEERLLAAPNLTASEHDEDLVAGIVDNPYAIGFFGYAYYQEQTDNLTALTVEGVAPSEASVNSGEYPLARPLYLYSTPQILTDKPQVAAFLNYYAANVNTEIDTVGYFAAPAEMVAGNLAALAAAAPAVDAADGAIAVAGSSTVYPLTAHMAAQFAAAGFGGEIAIDNIGTTAGLVRFCDGRDVDIANASRAMTRVETELCTENRRTPLELRVGTDALAVVVSAQNTFLSAVTIEQLRTIFTTAETWADVDPAWPAEPIVRYVPGIDSGTLDFFVETVFDRELADLPKETLVEILENNISAGLLRRFENDKPFAERTQEEVYDLVLERVVDPRIVKSWSLRDSLFMRSAIEVEAAEIQNGELSFRSWLTLDFLTDSQSPLPQNAGVRTAILGSLWVILITLLFSLPIGVGAAIYLEEYAEAGWFNRFIEVNINNLAGVPSIIYGLLGLAVFVRIMEPLTSGKLFGLVDGTTANGRTVISAGLTLGLLILPLIIINAREAIRSVPSSLRQASYGLGATKWQTIWSHVLPNALPGILTGTILSISRALGETAPLVVIGASTFIVVDPEGPFSKFTTLPIQIYQWTSRPQAEFRNIAAAAILVLLILLLSLNASAVLLRNRFSTRT